MRCGELIAMFSFKLIGMAAEVKSCEILVTCSVQLPAMAEFPPHARNDTVDGVWCVVSKVSRPQLQPRIEPVTLSSQEQM